MSEKLKTYDDVRLEREQLEQRVDAWLRAKGWVHTSSTPGCYWLWCKRVSWAETNRDVRAKGGFSKRAITKEVMTDKDTALLLQRALDDE